MANMGDDGEADAASDMHERQRQAFAVLQDKYAHARHIACCPAMDLIAVLTVDGQLIVHRTISWQRLLHVKPSEVCFEVTAIEWSPDGLFLALGCDEGEVVVYEIETGEQRAELRALKRLHELQHQHAITAMHWTSISQRGARSSAQQQQHDSAMYFGDRASRFLPHDVVSGGATTAAASQPSVLVTADASGAIVLWWLGRVYLTKVFVPELVTAMQPDDQQSTATVIVERVRLASDLSRLFVVLSVAEDARLDTRAPPASSHSLDAPGGNDAPSSSPARHRRQRQLIALDLGAVQRAQRDVAFVTRVVASCHATLNALVLALRQVASEWKSATRVFELKLGLLGSLYEKYACEDPPQVDMLAVVASGITAPALAQYFAQDIQEMSIDRMQKALQSGCENLTALIEKTVKPGLVTLLFHLSELRGRAKWQRATFESTLGITAAQIDDLVATAQSLHVSIEAFGHAVQETRQDLLLLFQWLLTRIRVHTNATATLPDGSVAPDPTGSDVTKSLLNQRRLCSFLQRAAHAALQFRDAQPAHSKFRVETTFGNLVSKQLAKSKSKSTLSVSSGNELLPSSSAVYVSSLEVLEALESKWFAMLERLTQSVARTIAVDASGCIDLGDDVDELALHFRYESDSYKDVGESSDDDDDGDDDDDDGLEAVDWRSLTSFALAQSDVSTRAQLMLGVRSCRSELMLLRATWSLDARDELGNQLTWHGAKLRLTPRGGAVELRGFDFYGDKASGRTEQLAYLVTELNAQDASPPQPQDWLHLQPYDQLPFTELVRASALHEQSARTAELQALPALSLPMRGRCRVRRLVTSASAAATSSTLPRVLANARRGIICASSLTNRLTILDAEDDDDDEDDDDNEEDGDAVDEEDGDCEQQSHT